MTATPATLGSVSAAMTFLDDLASRQAAPGGGAGAAMSAALAAALVAMVARSSSRLPDADAIAEEADRWRARAVELIDEDGRNYAEVVVAERERETDPAAFQAAVAGANRAPGEVVGLADRITQVGARLVEIGAPRLRGDAITAVILGASAASAATELIGLNTAYGQLADDEVGLARDRRDACQARADRVRTVR